MSEADLTLAAVSRRQFAAFAWRQAREAGLHDATIAGRLARGRYRELLPGVLADEDVTQLGPLAATSAHRTIADLAGELGPVALRRTFADAVRRGLTGAIELRTLCRRLGRTRGKRQLLALVDELSPLDGDCRSELETRFLQLMRGSGLPPTAMNHPVEDAHCQRRVIDAAYLPERVPIELDSRLAHGTLLDWHDDLRRENAIVLTGWRPFLRFSWADVTQRPGGVVADVRRGLSTASSERLARS